MEYKLGHFYSHHQHFIMGWVQEEFKSHQEEAWRLIKGNRMHVFNAQSWSKKPRNFPPSLSLSPEKILIETHRKRSGIDRSSIMSSLYLFVWENNGILTTYYISQGSSIHFSLTPGALISLLVVNIKIWNTENRFGVCKKNRGNWSEKKKVKK
jgi:hypothetical protein